jgi:hypothetical protein
MGGYLFNFEEIPKDHNISDFVLGCLEFARIEKKVELKELKSLTLVYTKQGNIRVDRKGGGRPFVDSDGNVLATPGAKPILLKGNQEVYDKSAYSLYTLNQRNDYHDFKAMTLGTPPSKKTAAGRKAGESSSLEKSDTAGSKKRKREHKKRENSAKKKKRTGSPEMSKSQKNPTVIDDSDSEEDEQGREDDPTSSSSRSTSDDDLPKILIKRRTKKTVGEEEAQTEKSEITELKLQVADLKKKLEVEKIEKEELKKKLKFEKQQEKAEDKAISKMVQTAASIGTHLIETLVEDAMKLSTRLLDYDLDAPSLLLGHYHKTLADSLKTIEAEQNTIANLDEIMMNPHGAIARNGRHQEVPPEKIKELEEARKVVFDDVAKRREHKMTSWEFCVESSIDVYLSLN